MSQNYRDLAARLTADYPPSMETDKPHYVLEIYKNERHQARDAILQLLDQIDALRKEADAPFEPYPLPLFPDEVGPND
jgi:hypothetical protein